MRTFVSALKKTHMKNRLLIAGIALLSIFTITACTSNQGDPKAVAKNFFEALENKNWDEAAKYTTSDSKTAIELVKSIAEMGKAIGGDPAAKEEPEAKKEEVVYGEAIIDGDNATVPFTVNGETNDIKLKKEDGVWKVAFDKNTLKQTAAEKSGKSVEEINRELNEAGNELQKLNTDSLQKALNKAGELLQSDSLRKAMDKAGDVLQKVGEAMQEASKEKH